MEAKGRYVNVTFDGKTVQLKSKKVDRDYSISQIASIDFHDAGFLELGYVHFRASGDVYKLGRGANAVHFTKSESADFRALADAVRAAIAAPAVHGAGPAAPAANNDVMVSLRKLGELRDAGVVTAEEFEAKKAELLARL